MATFDTVISGGRIVDGTGSPAYSADIGVIDGRIAVIGNLSRAQSKQRIDAAGRIVAPGHVNQHSHYDVALFWDPYCSNAGENGVTTVVNANCGFGVAPVRSSDAERTMQMLETTEQIPVSHQRAALPWDWESFPEYLARVQQLPKGVNVLSYLPLNPLLVYVMGVDAAKTRRPTAAEMLKIHRLINEAMDAGAIGISMSAMGAEGNSHVDSDGTPMPTDVVEHDVILDICRALIERGEGVIQLLSHLVVYGDRSLTERVLALAKGSGVTVIHNAFMTSDLMADPDRYFRELRDEHPGYYSDQYDTYFFSRFDDVWETLLVGDNTLVATEGNLPTPEYLRTRRNNGAPPFASVNPVGPGPALPSPYYEQMRLAHISPLRPKSIAALKAVVRQQAHEQLKQLLPRRRFDLSLDYAAIVSARMVCHLFQLPLSVADEVLQKVGDIGRSNPAKEGKKSVDLSTFFVEMKPYIVPLVQSRRDAGADGSNGLVDGLVNYRTQSDQRALSDVEIADQLVCAMVGGMEAVPKVTSRGIMELWRRPDQLAAVRADLEKNIPIAVEEIIRYCAPAQYTFRTAHKDITVAGRHVKAGQRVASMLYSASRDEREFTNPDEFIWNRQIPRVISFGLGQHHCIGKHLAVLEVRTLIREFLAHVDSVEFLLEEAGRNAGYFQRGWISLPVIVGDQGHR